jgi:hypothetical protein
VLAHAAKPPRQRRLPGALAPSRQSPGTGGQRFNARHAVVAGCPRMRRGQWRQMAKRSRRPRRRAVRDSVGLRPRPRSKRLTKPIPWRRRAEHGAKVSYPALGFDDESFGDRSNSTWQGADRDRARGVTRADTGGIAYQPRSQLFQEIVSPGKSDPMVSTCGVRCSGKSDCEADE